MAINDSLDLHVYLQAGPISVYLYDVLLFAAAALLVAELFSRRGERIPRSNRSVVFLALGYCAYQLAVILPIAVMLHDLKPIAVFRELEIRLGIILLPFMYLVVLKYVTPRRVILLVDVMALALVLYVAYKYATVGPSYEGGTRLREVGGWAVFAFAFLILTSLFYFRPGIASYAAAMMGAVGIGLTNHRSGYLALIVVGAPLFFHFRRASVRTVVVLIVAASCVALVLVAAPSVRDNLDYSFRTMLNPTADQNARDRVDRPRLAWEYFTQHPLGDHAWNQRFYLMDLPDPFPPHNFVVQLLNEQGIVGLAFWGALFVAVGRVGWRNRSASRLDVVMLACFAFYLVFCLFNTNLVSEWNILLLAVPVGVILRRNAELVALRAEQRAEADSAPSGSAAARAQAA